MILPVVHGIFSLHQRLCRGLFHFLQHFQVGRQGLDFLLPAHQLFAVIT